MNVLTHRFGALALSLAASSLAAGDGIPRQALLIGNGHYPQLPLINPVGDVTALGTSLRQAGFEVRIETDLSRSAMLAAVREFGESLKPGGVSMLYFAGHGARGNGRSYLLPVEPSAGFSASDVLVNGVELQPLIMQIENAPSMLSVFVIDACRGTPSTTLGDITEETALRLQPGSVAVFATQPGGQAADGDEAGSPLVAAWIRHLAGPKSAISALINEIAVDVQFATDGRQIVWTQAAPLSDQPVFLQNSRKKAK